ncbi:MAG: right-handed parallel beta-helix repeat-containing protein [Candidatus Sumerlaeota bacterium]|nr:right-handed parallel beta-helix repeat-containing protein [Candidatus Sumerlaeota bacterium]
MPQSRSAHTTFWEVFCVIVAAIGCLAGASFASATPLIFYVDGDAGNDFNPGTSWTLAMKTLQPALDAARMAMGGEVWVKAGVYNESRPLSPSGSLRMISDVALYGGFAGGETARSQRDILANVTTIDGSTARGGAPAYHVVFMDSITTSVLDGFTITGGAANAFGPDGDGGGVYCWSVNESNRIANCVISSNSAVQFGGAILCNFSANPIIEHCLIGGNTAIIGGGISLTGGSASMISDCVISGNAALSGGGVYGYGVAATTITNCIISGNTAEGAGGGMIFRIAQINVVNCAVVDNTAATGGGIACSSMSPNKTAVNIINTIFSGNGAYAVWVEDADTVAPMINNLFFNNPDGDFLSQATSYTGALEINAHAPNSSGNLDGDPMFAMNGPMVIAGVWIGAAQFDGAVYTTLTAAANSFVPGALVGRFIAPDQTTTTSLRRQALIAGNTDSTVVVWGDASYTTVGATYKIVDYHLTYPSVAVDNGTSVSAPMTDAEGVARPVDVAGLGASGVDAFDIGPYEATVGSLLPDPAPSDPGARDITSTSITWIWRDNTYNEDQYDLWSGDGATAPSGGPVASVSSNTTAWTTNGLAVNSQYAFQTQAVNLVGSSAKTPSYTTWTMAARPNTPLLSKTAPDAVSIALAAGDGNPDWTEYAIRILPAPDGGAGWLQGADALGAAPAWKMFAAWTTQTITGLSPAAAYSVIVCARNGAGIPSPGAGAWIGAGADLARVLFVDAVLGDDGADGKTWNSALKTIQSGIEAAYGAGGGEVWVKAGLYNEARPTTESGALVMRSGVALYGGFAGGETELAQRDVAANVTTIDGSTARNDSTAYHVVLMYGTTDAGIDGFTITGGAWGDSVNEADLSGAGIYCWRANATNRIVNCVVRDNFAVIYGGGILCFDGSSPAIGNCQITGNSSYNMGGGIMCYQNSSPVITDCVVTSNMAYGFGGGIGCYMYSAPTVRNCTVTSNIAYSFGGGISCFMYCSPAIRNCTVTSNTTYNFGGGISCYMYCSPAIRDCTVTSNTSYYIGGGLSYFQYCSPVIRNCQIIGNSSSIGGGLMGQLYCQTTISGCDISGNSGGGIAGVSFSNHTISNSRICGNSGQMGGGLYLAQSNLDIAQCIVGGNSADTLGGGIYSQAGSFLQMANCMISGNSAKDYGGGVCIESTAYSQIANCTIADNTATTGGGIVAATGGPVEFSNTIFHANTRYAVCLLGGVPATFLNYCLFSSNPDGDLFDGATGYTGADNINATIPGATNNITGDPLFVMHGPEAVTGQWIAVSEYANGRTGLTAQADSFVPGALAGRLIAPDQTTSENLHRQALIVGNTSSTIVVIGDASYTTIGAIFRVVDYHLSYGSAAIDAGSASVAPLTDLDGAPRPIDIPGVGASGEDAFDIGAYEAAVDSLLPYPAPANPGAKDITSSSVTWTWSDNASYEESISIWSGAGMLAPGGDPTSTALAHSTQWTTSGLAANAPYAFQVAASNLAGSSAKAPNYTTWTLAALPKAPILSLAAPLTIAVALDALDGNPAWTEYAIFISPAPGGLGWLQGDGSLGAAPAWNVRASWGVPQIARLNPTTEYFVGVRARNSAGIETLDGPQARITTADRTRGTVAIVAHPTSATWLLTDGDADVTTGSGNALLQNIPTGAITVQWLNLEDFAPPLDNPMNQTLDAGTTITFEGRYTLPTNILADFLSGAIVDLTPEQLEAADANRDGVITIADLRILISRGR